MPKVEIDYSNTIIYKITCNDSNITDVYVVIQQTLFRENMLIKIVVQMQNHLIINVSYMKQYVVMVDGLIGKWK